MKAGRAVLVVSSLTPVGAAEKLARAGIPVYSARKTKKNELTLEVARKDLEKVFAILRGSCYNVKEVRRRGLSLLCRKCLDAAGLLIGGALFFLLASWLGTRVMKIEVVGSGAYYEAQVRDVLLRSGVAPLSAFPKDTSPIAAEILALPRVSFCSLRLDGGILTVEIEAAEEDAVPVHEPLRAPHAGRVTELIIVRGTPAVEVGAAVSQGEIVVQDAAVYGTRTEAVVVIARVTVEFDVSAHYAGTEEEAKNAAYLEFGDISELKTERAGDGWLVTGKARASAAMNLD